jgi:hypothetical protein
MEAHDLVLTEEVSTTGSETSEPDPVLLQELSDESHSPQAPGGYPHRLDTRKMMAMSTSSGVLSVVCLALPMLCIPP